MYIVFVVSEDVVSGDADTFCALLCVRDAEDAVRGRDGYDFDGYRLRVEVPHGRGGSRGGGGRPQRFGYMGRGGRGPPPRRGDYRVHVSGLPTTGSWQDLKDHMREAGDVTFADVYRDGTGVVEFSRRSDMEFALRNLDDTKFRSHEVSQSFKWLPSLA